jgi:hypothetical protein
MAEAAPDRASATQDLGLSPASGLAAKVAQQGMADA